MEKEEIEEGSKLITKFMELQTAFQDVQIWMDWKNETIPVWDKRDYWLLRELKYHSSWDWLMPVVEKIESLEDMDGKRIVTKWVHILGKGCIIEIDSMKDLEIIVCSEFHTPMTKIEAVFREVVKFIKWYNSKN